MSCQQCTPCFNDDAPKIILYVQPKCEVISCTIGKGNVSIWGTQPKSIDDAEDRDKWYEILTKLDIKQPPGGMCTDEQTAIAQSKKLGFPVMVRPSFVLGGRAMEIVYRSALP